jgi:hypothetical protein
MVYSENQVTKAFKSFINGAANWWHMRNEIGKCWEMYLRGEKPQEKDTISGDLFGGEL